MGRSKEESSTHCHVIQEGKRGVCMTKENQGGKIISLTYGRLSSLAIDPIEKKPLAHFYPGSMAMSISSIGCNFVCPWCQNSGLSTSLIDDVHTRFMHPEEVVEIAMAQDCTSSTRGQAGRGSTAQPSTERHASHALAAVKNERRSPSRRAQEAPDVGGTDVAAAHDTNVTSPQGPDQ